jgi:hypothetical protein
MIAVKDALPDGGAAQENPSYYLIISANNKVYFSY